MIIVGNKSKFILIPYDMIKDKNLLRNDLIIYGEILSLSKQKGYCYANSNYFMKENKISRSSLIRSLNRLKNNGYINCEYQCNETNSKKRIIYLSDEVVSYMTQGCFNNDTVGSVTDDTYNI